MKVELCLNVCYMKNGIMSKYMLMETEGKGKVFIR